MDENKLSTVGEIRRALSFRDDEDLVFFGDGGSNTLTFYRIKNRGGDKPLLQVEFNELFKIVDDE